MDVSSVTVGGIETACADQGAGETLLCLHGWGANLRYWRKVWPHLVPRFRCLAPDLPGFGLSAKPEDAPYTMEWYVAWIVSLLEAKKASRAVVLGHSMGGLIALLLAAGHPRRVGRLVLLNPVVQGSTALFPRSRFLMRPYVLPFFFAARRSLPFLRWAARDFVSSRPMEDEDLASIQRATFRSLVRSYQSITATDALPAAATIRVPALLVSSAEDRIVIPQQGEALERTLPGIRRIVQAGTGHCAQLEAPELFNPQVLSFLGEVPGPFRPRRW